MDIDYLIQLLNNKMIILTNARIQAFSNGDMPTINSIDTEILGVQNTIAQLNLVQQITNAAAASNSTPTDVIANGVTAIQNTPIIPDAPTAVLSFYDISTYASDPLYQQKISDILSLMPAMDSAAAIDAYISNEAIGSPLTGQIILSAAQQYNIDARLLMSILELESNFGTAGLAVTTQNPGNVGNTGSGTRTYNSWQDGVAAVAQWLSLHPAGSLAGVISTDAATAVAPITPITPVAMDPTAFTQTTQVVNNQPIVTSTPNSVADVATTTPDSTLPNDDASTTPAVTTDPNATSTSTPSSTPDIIDAIIDPQATSTPTSTAPTITSTSTDATASGTPLSMNVPKKKRNRFIV